MADRAAAAFGLEARYPFFDRRLVELCLALPSSQKLHRGWTRFVLRGAMAGLLPAEVQWRPGKTNLAPGFTRGLITSDRVLLEQLRHAAGERIEKYVDQPMLRRACDVALKSRAADAVFRIWSPLTLALWLRSDNATPVGAAVTRSEETQPMEPDTTTGPDATLSRTEPKRAYTTPELTVHGSVEIITGSIGTKNSDGFTGSSIG